MPIPPPGRFSPTLAYGVIDKTGKLTRFDTFEAPYASMVHDFMVTRNYVLFPVLPLTGSMQRAMSGKPAYAWEPDKALLCRRDEAQRRRLIGALVRVRSLLCLPSDECL